MTTPSGKMRANILEVLRLELGLKGQELSSEVGARRWPEWRAGRAKAQRGEVSLALEGK